MPATPAAWRLQAALEALSGEGVIATPTEAVWGLSCDPYSERAVRALLALKRRPLSKGLILVAAEIEQLEFLLADLPQQDQKRLQESWPGPVTWLVPHRCRLPAWIHGEHDTVAVRVSDHPVLRALCLCWGGALVSTSANPGGSQPARAAFQVRRYFGDELDGILPGAIGQSARPTSIRDLSSGELIRV